MGIRWEIFKARLGMGGPSKKDLRNLAAAEDHADKVFYASYDPVASKAEAEYDDLMEQRARERSEAIREDDGIAAAEEKLKASPKSDYERALDEAARRGSNMSQEREGSQERDGPER